MAVARFGEYMADEHYRLAESNYQAGDFSKCELECEKAMKLNPNHAPANALWLESQFLQGKGDCTSVCYFNEIDPEQTLIEIDHAFNRGTRSYNLGEYEVAEREFRKILEYSKWMPTGAKSVRNDR